MSQRPEAPAHAVALMMRFAERTSMTTDGTARRYLWTDAFATCNFLGLGRPDLAVALVDRVHATLGRHRGDDGRHGWLSGLDDDRGAGHPTLGGLRIGKPRAERRFDEPADERLEWERDGQYFHYLTKWMHALDQVARATGEPRFHAWARELADVAHRRFTYGSLTHRRMYWKMSVDLSRPQVASMGHHDPLDGLVTCLQLDATAAALPGAPHVPDLDDAIADFRGMIDPSTLATPDALGIGGLLVDASRLAQLRVHRPLAPRDQALARAIVDAAELGLRRYASGDELRQPAEHRLAFRELGLAIGLAAVLRPGSPTADRFARFEPLRARLESFWLEPAHRQTRTWTEHADINDVMLATALAPDGFTVLPGLAVPS